MSYTELLDIFWESHNPENPPTCTQYKSAIFYHDETQRQLAETTKLEREALYGTLHTEISAAQTFYRAEDYHQKWYLRNVTLVMNDFNTLYPDPRDFVDSTAAARVNGVVRRYYTGARLEAEIARFGLSAEANAALWSYAQD